MRSAPTADCASASAAAYGERLTNVFLVAIRLPVACGRVRRNEVERKGLRDSREVGGVARDEDPSVKTREGQTAQGPCALHEFLPFRPLRLTVTYWVEETRAARARWVDAGLVQAGDAGTLYVVDLSDLRD
jgi:hypothetical protein